MTAKVISTPLEKPMLINPRISRSPVNTDSIEALKPSTDRKVKGTFVNVETPGQPAKICGRFYKGQEYFTKVFQDNEKCEIPLSIARFINERCVYETHSYLQDEKGNPIKTGKFVARYKFMPDF